MPLAHLSIGTAASRIDLLNPDGYHAGDWKPQAGFTNDTFAASALADYRQLTSYQEATTFETIPLTLKQPTQDDTIQATQDLRRILRMARDYWVTRHQPDPVYLQARASCETNTRYAIIHAGDVPEDSNPYGELFLQPSNRVLMLQMLVVERGPWLETAPGTATCVAAAGYQEDFCYPSCLDFTDVTARVNCGSDASLDDLHAAALTAEGWFKITSADPIDRLISKASDADITAGGWVLYYTAGPRICFRVNYDTTDSVAIYDWYPDNEWHHWAGTFNAAGDDKARLWLDGVLVATAADAAAGTAETDAAVDLIICNRPSYDTAPTGSVGWVRVSSSERYTVAFTPQAQCKLPDVDAATELLVIYEGTGATTYDLSGNGNDGTITDMTWDCDCTADVGQTTASCDADTVFVANKQNTSQLTHIYNYDAAPAAWSGNLLGNAPPYDLLPAVPAAGDILYVGIAEGGADTPTGPFCSIVFNLIAGSGITTAVWEYWSGAAWATLTVQDNTNSFNNYPYEESVHWSQPNDWAAVDLVTAVGAGAPLVSAWWVRFRITVAAGGANRPQQLAGQPYTVTWPWVEVEAAQVPGDFEAWLKAVLENRSDDRDGPTTPELYFNQAIIGLRSTDRGGTFWPYINATDNDSQNSEDIGCAAVGAGAFAARTDSPTGEVLRVTNPGAAWAIAWRIYIVSPTSEAYYGVYHAFLRAEMTSGATGDIKVRYTASVSSTIPTTTYTSKPVNIPARVTAGVFTTVDLGRLELPPSGVILPSEFVGMMLDIALYGNGAADVDICDLVLMPVDEWAIRATGSSTVARTSAVQFSEQLYIDSITNPKVPIRALRTVAMGIGAHTTTNPQIYSAWSAAANGPAILHPNVKQRLYFFFPETEQSGGVLESRFEVCATAQLYRQARYLSMRGDR